MAGQVIAFPLHRVRVPLSGYDVAEQMAAGRRPCSLHCYWWVTDGDSACAACGNSQGDDNSGPEPEPAA